jgi:hypothetical protein
MNVILKLWGLFNTGDNSTLTRALATLYVVGCAIKETLDQLLPILAGLPGVGQ